jgi:xanthine dehydrogenase YagR molybdenum-binding subunit
LVEFSTSPGIYSGIMTVQTTGNVTMQTPIAENGSGALTVFRQIVAEEFEVPVEQVSIEQSIDNIEEDRGVGGSRTTRLVGKLAINLAQRLQTRLANVLAGEFGLAPTELVFKAGRFHALDGREWSLGDAASLAGEDLIEQMTLNATIADRSVTFMAQAAEVQVDRATGQVRPLKLVSVHEVGRVINPMLFRTQILGGALQGLGYALMEGLALDDGRVTNTNLHEYKIPSMADLPEFEAILLPPDLSLGITPIGEGANAGMAPALVNAVMDAIGPEPFDIPLSPEAILAALLNSDGVEVRRAQA